jgi:mannose-6-phosphate isomerase-like protein (cupin superfamily)
VLWTGPHTQLVIMTIPVDGEIGEEVHEDSDQILTIVSGTGRGAARRRDAGGRPGRAARRARRHESQRPQHGVNPLVLYTVYGPPDHADGVVHRTKEEAEAAEAAGEDEPPTS